MRTSSHRYENQLVWIGPNVYSSLANWLKAFIVHMCIVAWAKWAVEAHHGPRKQENIWKWERTQRRVGWPKALNESSNFLQNKSTGEAKKHESSIMKQWKCESSRKLLLHCDKRWTMWCELEFYEHQRYLSMMKDESRGETHNFNTGLDVILSPTKQNPSQKTSRGWCW